MTDGSEKIVRPALYELPLLNLLPNMGDWRWVLLSEIAAVLGISEFAVIQAYGALSDQAPQLSIYVALENIAMLINMSEMKEEDLTGKVYVPAGFSKRLFEAHDRGYTRVELVQKILLRGLPEPANLLRKFPISNTKNQFFVAMGVVE